MLLNFMKLFGFVYHFVVVFYQGLQPQSHHGMTLNEWVMLVRPFGLVVYYYYLFIYIIYLFKQLLPS